MFFLKHGVLYGVIPGAFFGLKNTPKCVSGRGSAEGGYPLPYPTPLGAFWRFDFGEGLSPNTFL